MSKPVNSGSYFYNYKGYFSTVLLGICDADYKFLYVSVGAEGKASDGGIWQQCSFHEYLHDQSNPLQIPTPVNIPGTEYNTPFYLVGDDAFRLSPNLMKRFPGIGLTRKQQIFNYRLSRCRRIIENTFGIMCCRFRVLRQSLEVAPSFVDDIVMSCCILHNYLRINARNEYLPNVAIDREVEEGHIIPGAWRQEVINLDPMQKDSQKNSTSYAKNVRANLADYFLTPDGEISWQYQKSKE
jgi:hypothetical protein